MTDSIAKKYISALGVYEPGRPMDEVARELGFADASEMIKLASNENALGPSPLAVRAMKKAAADMHLYPDGGGYYLRKALSEKYGLDMDQFILGDGSNELIQFLAHVYLEKGSRIIMADRAFVVYRLIASAFEAETDMIPMLEFRHDLKAMLAAVRPETKIIFVGNPNNPTGTMVYRDEIEEFMDKVPQNVAVVFDEAYIELLEPKQQPDTIQYIAKHPHFYILRTFSKTYGLAGLRIGYGMASKENIRLLHHVRQPFNVNAMALAAAEAALGDERHVRRTRKMVKKGLNQLQAAFDEIGLPWVPSLVNFILVKVDRGRQVFDELQKRKVIVRPMDGYGLPDYIRVTVGTEEQNRIFIENLSEVLASRGDQ